MQYIQIHRRPRAERKPIRLGAMLCKRTVLAHGRRLEVKRDEVAAHGVEEVVVRHAHGFEVPEGVLEVGGEVGEGRHVHLVRMGVRRVDHGGGGVEHGEGGVMGLRVGVRVLMLREWVVGGEVGNELLGCGVLRVGEECGGVVAGSDGGFDGVLGGVIDVRHLVLLLESGSVQRLAVFTLKRR